MFCRVSRPRAPILIEGSIVPGLVLIYFSQLGGRLKTHQEVMLASDAEAIAGLKGYEFGGSYETAQSYPRPLYFVPDDTLLEDEARTLGICAPSDLFGGVVRYPFMNTARCPSDRFSKEQGHFDRFDTNRGQQCSGCSRDSIYKYIERYPELQEYRRIHGFCVKFVKFELGGSSTSTKPSPVHAFEQHREMIFERCKD
jgi:Protein of unknown function (DUF3182)